MSASSVESRRKLLLLAAGLTLGAWGARAHERFRVIGTLTRHRSRAIEVKDKNGKTTSIRINKLTSITRDKKKLDISELKTGMSVVVDALGDSEADLLATVVQIVPAPAGSKK
jgi:hypothetical protein